MLVCSLPIICVGNAEAQVNVGYYNLQRARMERWRRIAASIMAGGWTATTPSLLSIVSKRDDVKGSRRR